MAAVLDTHAAVWYLLDARRLSPKAALMIDAAAQKGAPVFVSAVSLVEVVYLVERRRLPSNALDKLLGELKQEQPAFRIVPVDSAVAETVQRVSRTAVPDMPDRIIAATALYLGLPLVTRDQRIQSAGIQTIC